VSDIAAKIPAGGRGGRHGRSGAEGVVSKSVGEYPFTRQARLSSFLSRRGATLNGRSSITRRASRSRPSRIESQSRQ